MTLKGLEMQGSTLMIVTAVAAIQALLSQFLPDQVWPFVLALTAASIAELLRRSDRS